MTESSGSGKAKILVHLIKQKCDDYCNIIDKIY